MLQTWLELINLFCKYTISPVLFVVLLTGPILFYMVTYNKYKTIQLSLGNIMGLL